jgi:hypothetical protein
LPEKSLVNDQFTLNAKLIFMAVINTIETLVGDSLALMEGMRPKEESTGKFLSATAANVQGCYGFLTIDDVNIFEVCWTVNPTDESVVITLKVFGWVAGSYTLSSTKTCVDIILYPTPITKLDIQVCVDWNASALTLNGDACYLYISGWQCQRYNFITLAAWNPGMGKVGNDIAAHPPVINFEGHSYSNIPTITRINIDNYERSGTNVGSIVKKKFFDKYPDFIFNVCFTVGPLDSQQRGSYGTPQSPWFNVFAGYYQLDVPIATWKRPFGYKKLQQGKLPELFIEDLARIIKADWNYFSNWMYGVPDVSIEPFNNIKMEDFVTKQYPREQIGTKYWDSLELNMQGPSAQVVSGFVSSKGKLVMNSVLTPAWQLSFGTPLQQGDTKSFPGCNMFGKMYMSFFENNGYYSTVIFGGTVNNKFGATINDPFMQVQVNALKSVISAYYPDLGFPKPGE